MSIETLTYNKAYWDGYRSYGKDEPYPFGNGNLYYIAYWDGFRQAQFDDIEAECPCGDYGD